MITPNSKIHFCKGVRLDSGYNNTYSKSRFADTQAQATFFLSKSNLAKVDYSYIREDGYLRIDEPYETMIGYDYIMYQNTAYKNKWFYAFIDRVEYKNDDVSFVYFTLDVMQTFLFDYSLLPSFVEREHTDDTQLNTQTESVHYGDVYRTVAVDRFYPYQTNQPNMGEIRFALLATKTNILETNVANQYVSNTMTGIETPLHYYLIPYYDKQAESGEWFYGVPTMVNGNPAMSSLNTIYQRLATNPDYINQVVSIQLLDYVPLDITIDVSSGNADVQCSQLAPSSVSGLNNLTLARILDNKAFAKQIADVNAKSKLPAYEFNKLYNYPYSYYEVTDNQGHSLVIRPEHLNGNLKIKARGNISTAHKTVYNVLNYKGLSDDISNAIINDSISTLPVLADATQAYIQSGVNAERTSVATNALTSGWAQAQATSTVAMAVAGKSVGLGATLGVAGAIGGAGLAVGTIVAQKIAQYKDLENRPPSLSSQGNNATYDYGNDNVGIFIKYHTVTQEYADMLTSYFKAYGYAINKHKVPETSTRLHWNYVKTVGCLLNSDIAKTFQDKIVSIYDKGVTLWHVDDIGDYSLGNGVR